MARRCLSTTQEGQASGRVMATCMAMGQAGWAAAALSLTLGAEPPAYFIAEAIYITY